MDIVEDNNWNDIISTNKNNIVNEENTNLNIRITNESPVR
jgi:hypothetical protein